MISNDLLAYLPHEISRKILTIYCDSPTIGNVAQVCRSWNNHVALGSFILVKAISAKIRHSLPAYPKMR